MGAMGAVRAMAAVVVVAAALLAGCDVKDPIYNTPHPEQGKITLTTDWSSIGKGLTPPTGYTVKAGDYSATLNATTNLLDYLFVPGSYRVHIYNVAEHVTVSGTIATVVEASGNVDGAGKFIHNTPGWLFTSAMDARVEADTDHALTAVMQQQVRQLTLFIEPTGGTTDRIEHIEGYLSGSASTLDLDNATHATPMNVELQFEKVTSGDNAGKWSATVRLLGVAGVGQKLYAKIFFEGNNPGPVSLTDGDGNEGCDLTEALAGFNADKRTPLALGGKVVETPTGAGFTATITDWTPVNSGLVVAN